MTSEQFFIYAGIAIAALLLAFVFIQWAHEIHKRNRYLKAQINLLAKIAEKQGVSTDEIAVIMDVADRRDAFLS